MVALALPCPHANAQSQPHRLPLSATDIADIVTLERLEDRREFDAPALRQIAASRHSELRRRAALAIARLYDPRGRALLRAMHAEPDTAVLATVAWATGQLVDTSAVPWLDSLLQNSRTPVSVATEAAGAFGKIRTSDTRLRLARYLKGAAAGAKTAPVVEEALLAIGRHTTRGDIAPITKWTSSSDAEIRWRAAWALFRPRDPAAVRPLMKLAADKSADVRFWAMRGLSGPRADSSGVGSAAALQILVAGIHDADRRVQTEATRTLGTHSGSISLIQLTLLLDSKDPWVAVTAAEALGQRGDNAHGAISPLVAATTPEFPGWTRAAALEALASISGPAALQPATALAMDTSWVVRNAAVNVLARLGTTAHVALEKLQDDKDRGIRATAIQALFTLADSANDISARRTVRRSSFASPDAVARLAAAASMSAWADGTDIPMLLDAFAVAEKDTSPAAAEATVETLASIEARGGGAADAFFKRYPSAPSDVLYGIVGRAFGPKTLAAWGTGRPIRSPRTDADYTRIVETLVVPAYNGASAPRLRWTTTRGDVDTELNALDAPLATDYLIDLTTRDAMTNIRFDRVVPNFVDQQKEALLDESLQRDEISRARLTRGNLSWGSEIGNAARFPGTRGPGAAYDTGPAVYTFGITPQPHNEGDFTSLGRITRGMAVADQIELGDFVKSVRVLKAGEQ